MAVINHIQPPTPEELDAYTRKLYEDALSDPSHFPNWYDGLSKYFRTPDSVFVPIDLARFSWLSCDDYADDRIEEFGAYLMGYLEKAQALGFGFPVFLKGSTFSNKFNFVDCVVHEGITAAELGRKALDIFYMAMCGDRYDAGFVFRRFIAAPDGTPSIYEGMPLRPEFRVFYDFDRKLVLCVKPYWDVPTMTRGLYDPADRESFAQAAPALEAAFLANAHAVSRHVSDALAGYVGRPGGVRSASIWSLDFLMEPDGTLWFIDAAVGFRSHSYDTLEADDRALDRIYTKEYPGGRPVLA